MPKTCVWQSAPWPNCDTTRYVFNVYPGPPLIATVPTVSLTQRAAPARHPGPVQSLATALHLLGWLGCGAC